MKGRNKVLAEKICGGGDSAGGKMTAAVALRRKDNGKKPLKAQLLLHPEARLPFDTKAAIDNNSGYYLECKSSNNANALKPTVRGVGNGTFSFADHYAIRGVP
jgi:acetyl esterase/lipase